MLHVKSPPTREEMEEAVGLLKENERAILAIAAELREQQKLLVELRKQKIPNEPINGFAFERLGRMSEELNSALVSLRAETKALRMSLEGKK